MKFCPQCAQPLIERAIHGEERRACPDESCGFVDWNNPTPVVAALVEHEGEVLLVQNKGWPAKWFGLVSGFLEAGETPEAGMLREVEEEVGLWGEIAELIGVYAFVEFNQVIIAYHVRAEGEVVLGEELAGVKRIPPAKLRPWKMGTGQAVADWLAKRGQSGQ